MSAMRIAEILSSGAIHRALRYLEPQVCRKRMEAIRQETGESVPRIYERLQGEPIAEVVRQTGNCPATVRRLRDRW